MKRFLVSLPLILLVFSFVSCNKQEENDIIYDQMVTLTEIKDYPVFQTDNGYFLNGTNLKSPNTEDYKVGNRYYLRYSFADTTSHPAKTYDIVLNSVFTVAKKGFVNLERDTEDPYKNQALQGLFFREVSGNYLNMVFSTFNSQSGNEDFLLVRMKKEENNSVSDELPTVCFELRHNVTITYAYDYSTRMASFDLTPLTTEFTAAKKIRVKLKSTIYNYATTLMDTCSFMYTPKVISTTAGVAPKRGKLSTVNL